MINLRGLTRSEIKDEQMMYAAMYGSSDVFTDGSEGDTIDSSEDDGLPDVTTSAPSPTMMDEAPIHDGDQEHVQEQLSLPGM